MLYSAKTLYKKQAGLLELTSSHLQWTREGETTQTVYVPLIDANALFCSKEGATQVKLKLALKNDDQGHNFVFISDNALEERDKFKRDLTSVIGKNRSRESGKSNANPSSSSHKSELLNQRSNTSTPVALGREGSVSRRTSVTPQSSGLAPEDFRLCKKVLMKNNELANLHKQLVIGGQISEAEFWEGRQHLLRAEEAYERQKQGRPGTLVDPRPETLPSGEIKIVITPQLVHDIFEEFPVVAQAYSENVPSTLSEASFWQRYFQSKLFFSHQASIRSAAAQHVVKADPIFDKYLRQADDGLQPLCVRQNVGYRVIDLAATEEDHGDTGTAQDITMQAGKQKAALPLIRRFNEHSERLLKSSLGESQKGKVQPLRSESFENDTYFDLVDLVDLHDPFQLDEVPLQIDQNRRLFDISAGLGSAVQTQIDLTEAVTSAKRGLEDWNTQLSLLCLEKKSVDLAVLGMTEGVQKKLAIQLASADLPNQLVSQMATCHTAANEFLRQFWCSLFPSLQDMRNPSFSKLTEQREAKAAKMISYLQSTQEKVEALYSLARQLNIDSTIVETVSAIKPRYFT